MWIHAYRKHNGTFNRSDFGCFIGFLFGGSWMVSPVRHLLLQSQGLFLSSGGVVKNSPEVFAMYSWMKNVSFYSIIYIRVFTFEKMVQSFIIVFFYLKINVISMILFIFIVSCFKRTYLVYLPHHTPLHWLCSATNECYEQFEMRIIHT